MEKKKTAKKNQNVVKKEKKVNTNKKNNKIKIENKKRFIIVLLVMAVVVALGVFCKFNRTNKYDKYLNKIEFGMSSTEIEKILKCKGVDAKIELDPLWKGVYMNYTLDKENDVVMTVIYENKRELTDVSSAYINDVEIKEYKNKKVKRENIEKAIVKLNETSQGKAVTLGEIENIIGTKAYICSKEIDYTDNSYILTYVFVTNDLDYLLVEVRDNHENVPVQNLNVKYTLYKLDGAHYSIVVKPSNIK